MTKRRVLVTGASGLLGRQVQRLFQLEGWEVTGVGLSRLNPPEVTKLDLLDTQEIDRVFKEVKPHAVIHCAANRFPTSCATNPSAARLINVAASCDLAHATISNDALLIYISTDYVFSGKPGEAPYTTTSTPNPPNEYGQTKLKGENAVLEEFSRHGEGTKNKVAVLRLPILYGKCDEPGESAVNVLLEQLWKSQEIIEGRESGEKIKVDDYALRYPTNTADVARVCQDICQLYLDPENADRDLPKILHFSSEDKMTKWDIVKTFSEIMGLPLDGMEPERPQDGEGGDGVKRPYDCHLDTSVLRDLGIDVGTVDFRYWWRREVGAFRH